MAELGIVAAQGREGVKELVKIIASEQDARLPACSRAAASNRTKKISASIATTSLSQSNT